MLFSLGFLEGTGQLLERIQQGSTLNGKGMGQQIGNILNLNAF